MHDRINLLIAEHGFHLHAWESRYGGFWICLMPGIDQVAFVADATEYGDCDMIPLTGYLRSTDWLPIVVASDLMSALDALDERLSSLPEAVLGRATAWSEQIVSAVEHAEQVMLTSKDYGECDGRFAVLPKSFFDLAAE